MAIMLMGDNFLCLMKRHLSAGLRRGFDAEPTFFEAERHQREEATPRLLSEHTEDLSGDKKTLGGGAGAPAQKLCGRLSV